MWHQALGQGADPLQELWPHRAHQRHTQVQAMWAGLRSNSQHVHVRCREILDVFFLFMCQVILNIVGCLITLMSTWEENRLLLLFHIIFLCFRSSQQLMQLLELSLMDSTYILRILYELNVLPLALQITNICGNVLVNNPWEIYFVIINPKK